MATFYDSKGVEIRKGDLLKVAGHYSKRDGFFFYTRFQVYHGRLWPFAQFSYNQVQKVEELPEGAVKNNTTDVPDYWMAKVTEPEKLEEFSAWFVDQLHHLKHRQPFVIFDESDIT